MIKVNFADGRTKQYDLERGSEALAFRKAIGQGPPNHVTALCIFRQPYSHTLPKPIGVGFVSGAGAKMVYNGKNNKRVGECIWFDVGGCRVKKTVYHGQKSKLTRTEILPRRVKT